MENVKMIDFLKEESVIKTKLDKANDWIPNIAYKIYNDEELLEIALDERYLQSLVMVGDVMEVTQTLEGYEYIMEGIITQIKIEPTRTIILKINEIKKIPNYRKDERYSVSYATTVKSFAEEEGVFGVVVNISISGLAFVCKTSFVPGELVILSIMLPASTFSIDAEIVRVSETEKGYEYGVKFLRTDEEAVSDIKKLIEDIKEREDRLSRIVGFRLF